MEDEAKHNLDTLLKAECPQESLRVTVTPSPKDYLVMNPDMAKVMRIPKKPNTELEESDFQKLLPDGRLDQSPKLEIEHSNGMLAAPQKIKEELNPFLTVLRSQKTQEQAEQQKLMAIEAQKKALKAAASHKHKPHVVQPEKRRKSFPKR